MFGKKRLKKFGKIWKKWKIQNSTSENNGNWSNGFIDMWSNSKEIES
jgi:hypothetical protein